MSIEREWTCPECNRTFQYVVPHFPHRCTKTFGVQKKESSIEGEIDQFISNLKLSGISSPKEAIGAGDVVAKVLGVMGITPSRVEQWLGIDGCGCTKRKQWLNKIFSVDKGK